MHNNVLLLGNGINNIERGYTWKDLVNDLVKDTGTSSLVNISDHKPFPLLYEEIYLQALRKKRMKERAVKEFICSKALRMQPNVIHKKVMGLGFGHILTTNYDHNLEHAAGEKEGKISNSGRVKENLYSIFRYNRVGKTKLWHIHGECSSPQSVTLGYEHYSGYLQRMRNYVVNGTDEAYKTRFAPLIKRLPRKQVKEDSWIDLFFTSDIHILGLTLDFVEMHLWWLLTFRARWKLERRFPLRNRIVYYYPGRYSKEISHKLELFRSIEVETVAVGTKADKAFYEKVLGSIKKTS